MERRRGPCCTISASYTYWGTCWDEWGARAEAYEEKKKKIKSKIKIKSKKIRRRSRCEDYYVRV